jgi:FkbM family methyltransferase
MNAPLSWSPDTDRGGDWSMRSLAKASLLGAASWLPAIVRGALLRGLAASSDGYETLQALGRRHGVRDLRIAGDYGLIEGSIDDGGVLRSYAMTKSWAEPGNRLFVELFDRPGGGTYIDIGANIGLTTIPIAKNAAVACKAFEPSPENLRYLKSNLATNCPYANVEIFDLALFDAPGTLEFELSDRNLGDHRIRVRNTDGQWGESQRSVIQVRADRLDDVLTPSALAGPIGAKIATQGAESQVFSGGRSLLEAADLVAFEFWPYGIARANGDPGVVTSFIREHFRSGAVIAGGSDERPIWQPIETLVEMLTDFVNRRDRSPYDYYDGFARK